MKVKGEVYSLDEFIGNDNKAYEYLKMFESPENDIQIEAIIEITPENKTAEVKNDSAIFGFMLFCRQLIAQYYWKSRVMATRYDKSRFFSEDEYIDWLTNIFGLLKNTYEFGSPMKNFKFDKAVSTGGPAKQLRYWFTKSLMSLARIMKKEDQEFETDDISIEGATELESGFDRKLDAAVSMNSKSTHDASYSVDVLDLKQTVASIVKNGELDIIVGTDKSNPKKRTALDMLYVIIDPETSDYVLSSVMNISDYMGMDWSVGRKYKEVIAEVFKKYDITPSTFFDIIKTDPDSILNILSGEITLDDLK